LPDQGVYELQPWFYLPSSPLDNGFRFMALHIKKCSQLIPEIEFYLSLFEEYLMKE